MRVQISNALSKRHYKMIKIIMSTALLLGLYSKVHKSFAFTIVAKVYCLSFAIVLIYFFSTLWLPFLDMFTFTVLMFYIVIYASSVIVLLWTDGEHLSNYMDEFDKLDPMGLVEMANLKVLFTFVVYIVLIILHLQRLTWYLTIKRIFQKKMVVVNSLLVLATHLSHMTRILMFEILLIRMRSLRKTMDNYSNITSEYNVGQIQLQIRNLEDFLDIYKKILENVKKIGHGTKFLILLTLPPCLVLLLAYVDLLSGRVKFRNFVVGIIEIELDIILPCIPALFGELITSEVEKIKSILAGQYRVCRNDKLQKRILDGIKLIELRPFKFTVWRLFTIDLSLPLAVFNICTNYAIILLQFKQILISAAP